MFSGKLIEFVIQQEKTFTKYQKIAEENKAREKSFPFELLCAGETRKEGRNEVSLRRKDISIGKYNQNIFIFYLYCLTSLIYTPKKLVYSEGIEILDN